MPDFDLGEYLGIGLDTTQIAHLAGALFLGLFGISALRHASRSGGFWPAGWIAVSLALFAGTLVVVSRGFPEHLPEFLKNWTDPDRLARGVAVLSLLGLSAVLLSAHWVRPGLGRFWYRLAGLACLGLSFWLVAGWFGEELPDEARPWTERDAIVRVVAVLGLTCLAGALWIRAYWSDPHIRWLNRSLVPVVAAGVVLLTARWFVEPHWADYPRERVENAVYLLTALAVGSCLFIALAGYFLRDHKEPARRSRVVLRDD